MSASFAIAGFCLGVLVSRTSAAEPAWCMFIIPAAGAFLAGVFLQVEGKP